MMKLGMVVGFLCAFSVFLSAVADAPEAETAHDAEARAVLLHNRIAGVPPRAEVLARMVDLLEQGDKEKNLEAALLATEDSGFYNLKLLSMFSVWANVAGDGGIPLNDMTATMIGIVRDDIPFKEVLYGDHIYLGNDKITKTDSDNDYKDLIGGDPSGQDLCDSAQKPEGDKVIPPYLSNSNDHYRCLQKYDYDLQDSLQQYKQSSMPRYRLGEGINFALVIKDSLENKEKEAIAGILSTREFAKAYYSAGTNRRATAFVLKYFLCHEMEELHDTNISDEYVRRDVDRSPGNDVSLFRKRCLGCHGGMDALSGWNIYYHYAEQLSPDRPYSGKKLMYKEGVGKDKVNKNVAHCLCESEDERSKCKRGWKSLPSCTIVGHRPEDDSFVNLWAEGQNAALGWRGETKGKGARAWGKMMAESKAFSSCMAKQVYEQVCFVKPVSDAEQKLTASLSADFENNNYNMRRLFAATAVACLMEDN